MATSKKRRRKKREEGWGETVNTFLVQTCGRNSILPECQGAEGFTVFPAGDMPKTKKALYRGAIYRQASDDTFEQLWEYWLEGDPFGGHQPLKDEIWTLKKVLRGRDDEEIEATARENLEIEHKEKVRRRYENSLARIDTLDDKDCFRVMELERGHDPTQVNPLGTFWATTASGASSYWGTGGGDKQWVMYRGRIDTQYIDRDVTVMNNVLYPEEFEVSFVEGSPIYVYDVTLGGRYQQTFPIKEERTC